MEKKPLYADVILPLPVENYFTYIIPETLQDKIAPGKRVIVQFGKRKYYAAIVRRLHHQEPVLYKPKSVQSVLDDQPVVHELQLQLWDWIAEYYLCTVGEVMNAALPASLKLASETLLILNPEIDNHLPGLPDDAFIVVEALRRQQQLTIEGIQKLLGKRNVYPVIKELLHAGIVDVMEEIKPRYKPKKVKHIRLHEQYEDMEKLESLFNDLERAPKQLHTLLTYIQLQGEKGEVSKAELIQRAQCDAGLIKRMIDKGIFVEYSVETGRIPEYTANQQEEYTLTRAQQTAYEQIKAQFQHKQTVLLHGVTSSGKTLIYIKLIQEAIATGKQALYLLPEIALTAQIINRLRKVFGNAIGVYHSRFSNNERVEIWQKVHNKEYKVILGARSAIFMPFSNLGLIIIDEEQDASFKQFDPAPRYQCRDAAIYYAGITGAKVLLGSGTPSIESYYNALSGKYGLVALTERYGGTELPEIVVVDLREQLKKRAMKGHFSRLLLEAIRQTIRNGDQVILFQNRRGYAPMMVCKTCGYVPSCKNCDVGMTYHKFSAQLRCHYCGYRSKVPVKCPACGSQHIEIAGFGTEKVEEDLKNLLPEAIVVRMDYDAVRTKESHNRIISDFEKGKYNVLVGTQMVTKGLDFDRVKLVGIVNADQLMSYPDFRSSERAFQLMEQVSGRAGRRAERGKVFIQTYKPEHPVIQYVLRHDYAGFFNDELRERHQYHYPPYTRLIRLSLRHRTFQTVNSASIYFAGQLRDHLGERILGPTQPVIARIRGQYLMDILLKLEKDSALIKKAKSLVKRISDEMKSHAQWRQVRIIPDVDP